MRIVNWVFGIFALAMLVIFLGKYAVSIGSLPLWIIIVGVLILPILDLVKSMKDSDDSEKSPDSSEG